MHGHPSVMEPLPVPVVWGEGRREDGVREVAGAVAGETRRDDSAYGREPVLL